MVPSSGRSPARTAGFRGAADRQARRPAGQDMRPRRRPARRPCRGRAAARVRRPFAARRPRLLRPDRGGPRPEASRPRQRRNDPPLPAQARPVHDQPHKGGRAIESTTQRLSGSRSRNSPRPGASRPESPAWLVPLSGKRSPLSFRRSLRRPRFLVEGSRCL